MLLLKAAGAKIAQRRLAEATHELKLLKEAQEIIGFHNSDHIETIDELKTEYWEIKGIQSKIEKIEEEEESIEESLQEAIAKRSEIFLQGDDKIQTLNNEIMKLVEEREIQLERRMKIFSEGKRVRKVYDGFKSKMDYLKVEVNEDDSQLKETANQIDECISNLGQLKNDRDIVVSQIEKIEEDINIKEETLEKIKGDSEFESFANNTDVGGQNKKLSELRREKSALKNELGKNVRHVGKFLFANRRDEDVRSCIKSHRQVLHQAAELRKSIILNHKIVDRDVELSSEG